jgi:hypothetical protein
MMRFTIEESNLIAMYAHKDRREILEELHQAVIYIKEPEMLELVHQTIDKIIKISDDDFAQEVFVAHETETIEDK